MELSTIVGIVAAFALTIFGIVFNGETLEIDFTAIGNFIDMPSVIIVIGGTIAAIIANVPFKTLAKVPAHFKIMSQKTQDPSTYIGIITELSQEARRNGLLHLEDKVNEYNDEFLRDSIMLIVDAVEPDKVRRRLESELENIEARHSEGWTIYDKGAQVAPGFGMIGTLIGLINMLAGMDLTGEGGASALAQNMAVALITTFYGSLLSNVVFSPIGTKLRIKHDEEMICKMVIIEGIISINAGENPRYINEKLCAFLDRKSREKINNSTGEARGESAE